MFGVFAANDLFLFFLFYELAVLPMYLLIGIWGTGPSEYSAMKLTLMLMGGSALILVGILVLYFQSDAPADQRSFSMIFLAQHKVPVSTQLWLFPVMFFGFGTLGGLWPFHTWSPDGHASAPTAVSMLHAGVLMKLGGYGCLKMMYLMPEGARAWGTFFMVLTTVNIFYGALIAVQKTDLKYITAYSSVSHCGLVLFGLGTLNMTAMQGACVQMFAHGLMTALFFALVGMIYGRTHTRYITEMGGPVESHAVSGGGLHDRRDERAGLAGSGGLHRRNPGLRRRLRQCLLGAPHHDPSGGVQRGDQRGLSPARPDPDALWADEGPAP